MPRTAKGKGTGAVESGARRRLTFEVGEPEFLIEEKTLAELGATVRMHEVRPRGFIASYGLLTGLSILLIATILLGRLISPLGDALHQVAQFLVR
jgi:hypothetical protein